jgi:hypothetical protein
VDHRPAPEGVEGFAALQKLGVKTIVSVDGSKPSLLLRRLMPKWHSQPLFPMMTSRLLPYWLP